MFCKVGRPVEIIPRGIIQSSCGLLAGVGDYGGLNLFINNSEAEILLEFFVKFSREICSLGRLRSVDRYKLILWIISDAVIFIVDKFHSLRSPLLARC